MAVITKKVGGASPGPVAPSVGARPQVSPLTLPTERSVPREDLGAYTWLIYGEKKIGKTSLAAQFPDALFTMFEPGGKGLSIYQTPIRTWDEFKEYIRLLKGTDQFRTVIIDTVDIAYERCMAYVGRREGFEHPSDQNDFGKSWQMVAKEFSATIYDLIATGRGVMFLSHAKESEFQEASGAKYNKIVPTMSGQVRSFVTGFVDIIAYYGYYGTERRLTVLGSDAVDAGHRIDGRFFSPEGERVHSIPMGNSPAEGYANILAAFQNQQAEALRPERESVLSTSQPKRPQGRK